MHARMTRIVNVCGLGPGIRINAPSYRARQDFDRSILGSDTELEDL
jgi:hypothetical protein